VHGRFHQANLLDQPQFDGATVMTMKTLNNKRFRMRRSAAEIT
jgi:hypothetical protein